MMLRRSIIAVFGLNLLSGSATAETLVIHPDPCPALADAPKIITMKDVEAVDLNPGRAALDRVLVLYPVRVKGWASARLLARFDLEDAPRRGAKTPTCR
jgi:hypothetical protein